MAFFMGLFALAASVSVYQELRLLGFPDGFLTELDRAERILGIIFIGVSFPAGLWFVFIGKKLWIAIVFYAVFVILLSAVDFYLRRHLMSGGGG